MRAVIGSPRTLLPATSTRLFLRPELVLLSVFLAEVGGTTAGMSGKHLHHFPRDRAEQQTPGVMGATYVEDPFVLVPQHDTAVESATG